MEGLEGTDVNWIRTPIGRIERDDDWIWTSVGRDNDWIRTLSLEGTLDADVVAGRDVVE